MATKNIAIIQAALKGLSEGKPDEYKAIVADDVEFSILGGLLPDELALGKGKEAFMNHFDTFTSGGMPFETVSFNTHSYHGYGPHVGFIADWEMKWKGKDGTVGPVVPLRAVVLKTLNDEGKMTRKLHMCDQRAAKMVKASAGDADATPAEIGTADAIVREALAGMMAGNPEAYMSKVADNIDFSILAGMLPGDKGVGSSKENFMGLMGVMGETMEQLSFKPYCYCGYKDYTTFLVHWEVKIKATDKIMQFSAVVAKKTDADGKICEKYHVIDQYLFQN